MKRNELIKVVCISFVLSVLLDYLGVSVNSGFGAFIGVMVTFGPTATRRRKSENVR
jgi:hypothetical protein